MIKCKIVHSLLYFMLLTHCPGALRLFLRRNTLTARLSSTAISAKHEVQNHLYPNFSFDILKQADGSKARLALLKTPHGNVETPNFIFCATRGAMKALTTEQLRAEGSQIMLSNTYHMMLTAGADLVERLGGLQKFTAWNGPMFTDSGGYQIFSMGHGTVASEIKGNKGNNGMSEQMLLGIDETGATFKSYVDGAVHVLTPEKSIDIQRKLGADLIVVLDECTPFNVDKNYTMDSMRRSHRWATRSLEEFKRTNTGKQALYGIVQGGIHHDLRDESTAYVNSQEFFGTAIGGSLGDTRKGMHDIVAYTRARVREDRPVHLLGIGGVLDIFNGVRQGIDTFDCVAPMRLARHGGALVRADHWSEEPHADSLAACEAEAQKKADSYADKKTKKFWEQQCSARQGRVSQQDEAVTAAYSTFHAEELAKQRTTLHKRLTNFHVSDHVKLRAYRMDHDPRPIDPTCGCYACKNFSRAYLKHCFAHGEALGGTLLSIHNAHFMNRLMRDIREGIKQNNLDEVEALYVHPKLRELLFSETLVEPLTLSEEEHSRSVGQGEFRGKLAATAAQAEAE